MRGIQLGYDPQRLLDRKPIGDGSRRPFRLAPLRNYSLGQVCEDGTFEILTSMDPSNRDRRKRVFPAQSLGGAMLRISYISILAFALLAAQPGFAKGGGDGGNGGGSNAGGGKGNSGGNESSGGGGNGGGRGGNDNGNSSSGRGSGSAEGRGGQGNGATGATEDVLGELVIKAMLTAAEPV